MTIDEIKKIDDAYNKQLLEISRKQKEFRDIHKNEFETLINKQREENKKWFVDHIDYILKYSEKFKTDNILGNILIDFFPFYKFGGLMAGVGFNGSYDRMFLSSLLKLWDKGFKYKSYLIVSMEQYIHNGSILFISYIKDAQIFKVKFDKAEEKPFTVEELNNFKNLIHSYYISKDKISIWDNYNTLDLLKNKTK